MAGQRFRTRLAAFTSIVAGFVALFVLTLALASRAEAYVYWNGGNSIGRANLDGTEVNPDFITGLRDANGELVVDETHVYWTTNHWDYGLHPTLIGTIGRANLDGSGVDNKFITGASDPWDMAVGAGYIYWINTHYDWTNFPAEDAIRTWTIGRANLDGSGVDQDFMTDLGEELSGVAVDDEHIYWTDNSRNTIGRANLDGTGVEESFIPTVGGVNGVAVDDTHLWWAYSARFTGGIVRANLDGTGRKTVIGDVEDFFPYGVAVDDTHVYWRGGFFSTAGLPIGRANLDGSRAEHEFLTGTGESIFGGLAVDELPFRFGDVKRNRKRGTAKLTLIVPGPGTLKLAKTGRVKRAKERAEVEGSVKLPVKPKGRAKKKLSRKGEAKVQAEVTFSPDDGEPNTQTTRVRLVKR